MGSRVSNHAISAVHFTPIRRTPPELLSPVYWNVPARPILYFICDVLHSFFFSSGGRSLLVCTVLYLFQVPAAAAVRSMYDLLYGNCSPCYM
jgi:hypothetical protein